MTETIFNLFLYVEKEIIQEIGVVTYEHDGTEKGKLSFLQSKVTEDSKNAEKHPLPKPYQDSPNGGLSKDRYEALVRVGKHLLIFEHIFQLKNAPPAPLLCITTITNHKPQIDKVMNINDIDSSIIDKSTGEEIFTDYLKKYLSDEGFNLSDLINDDYYNAIKLLFNNGHYVSSLKLLVSMIDTVSYLEYGDKGNIFVKWLDSYAELSKIGINSSELWELRNGILHMTNSESRKVSSGKVKRLLFFVGETTADIPKEHKERNTKYFSLNLLINVISKALENWASTLNNEKFADFVMRYDKVISDSRYMKFQLSEQPKEA